MNPLVRSKIKVKGAIGLADKDICAGCGKCVDLCIYSALWLHIP
jgi:ferredoxin